MVIAVIQTLASSEASFDLGCLSCDIAAVIELVRKWKE
jgi:hypothetical protein